MTDNTIAVLPFVNMSSDRENEYFSDGMTEEIINALACIGNLKVTSRTSSFYFKNKTVPLKEVARQLGVAVILEGSVRLAGNMVRITAQLIQAEDDFHFWSESWDRKLENIFEIQDEISLLIADRLREQYGHFEIRDHLVEKQTDSLDAYAYFLQAKYHFNKWNPEDVNRAIGLFEKALELDPEHAESYVGLADAYGFLATTEFMPREETWQKAAECTQKAFSLNKENAGVYYQLANLSFFTESNFKEATQHGLRALELMPNYPEAQQFIAFLHTISGEMDKARERLKRALSIDPLSQETLFYKAYFDYRLGNYEKAMQQLEENLAKNPKSIPANVVRSYCLLQLERYDEVLGLLEKMPDELIIPDEQLGITCLVYLFKNDKIKADKSFAQLKEKAKNQTALLAHSYLFLALAVMGKYDEAFAWLDETIKMKSSILLLSFTDPLTGDLRKDPRYSSYKKILYQLPDSSTRSTGKEPLMDTETADKNTTKLLQFINGEKPFLTPNLSLRSLAGQLQIHPNKLSWLLNECIGKNFNEFINHYRVAYFKQLAKDPANSHISLIGLAFESGFNSKTVFNTYFKKEVGMTPVEFLKQNG